MTIAFQPNAFQGTYPLSSTAFQTFDRIPDIDLTEVSVFPLMTITLGPLMASYKAGDSIVITAQVTDPSVKPSLLFDPDTFQINVLNPDGTLRVTLGSMIKMSTGEYSYTLQSLSNWPLGVYAINLKAVSGTYTAQTITQEAFKLV